MYKASCHAEAKTLQGEFQTACSVASIQSDCEWAVPAKKNLTLASSAYPHRHTVWVAMTRMKSLNHRWIHEPICHGNDGCRGYLWISRNMRM